MLNSCFHCKSSQKKWPGCVFFLLWPLFARAPRHWFLENFLLSAPGVQSVFFLLFFVALRWAPRPFGGARAKKKTPPRVFFFLAPAPGKGRGRRSPVGWAPARGQSKKKTHHPGPRMFFFLLRPRRGAREGEAPLEAGTGPEQKKTPPRVFLGGATTKKTPWPAGGVFFFVLWPRAGTQRGFSFPCLSPGPQQKKKKKTPWVVFFFCSGPVPARGFSFPCLSPGPEQQKKNTLGGVFFLLRPRADAHSLTAGLGGDASPSPGWCFFCCGPARTGVVFFFFLLWPRPDAHSLTVGWGDFGKARVVFFFLLRPRRVFLDNNKKCLGYYIGSKKTRRGHSKKKTPPPKRNETRRTTCERER